MALDDRRHPDAERLAEYADGVLPADARAEVERHLADCAECRAVVVETTAFLDQNPAIGEGAAAPVVLAFRPRRRWIEVAAGLAAAAALVLAVRVVRPEWAFGPRTDRPELQELIAAVANEPTRPVEGRLSGGFPYAPPPSPTRGSADHEVSPDVRIAAAKIEKAARGDADAGHLRAWGVAQLILGKHDDAVRNLEDAVRERPGDASIEADLAAAYLGRARAAGRVDDWSHALDAAERAIHKDPALIEPLYTRALALEQLRLDAGKAWREYLARDSASRWADEARAHLDAFEKLQKAGDRSRVDHDLSDAVGRSDADAEARLTAFDPQRVREYIEEDLAGTWARAVLAGDGIAESRARNAAIALAAVYSRYADDALPGELARDLGNPRAAAARHSLAAAVADYASAAQLVREDRLHEAEPILNRIGPALGALGSPLQYWVAYLTVLPLSQRGRLAECLARLSEIEPVCRSRSFNALCGTVLNRQGQIYGRQGSQERAVADRRRAIAYFERARDEDQVAVMHSQMSESYRLLTEPALAWSHHFEALRRLPVTHNYRSRHLVLVQAGMTSTFEGDHESAMWFQDAVVDNGRRWGRASATSTGLFHLARNLARLGRVDDAIARAREARAVVQQIPDPEFRERFELELLEVEGEIFGTREPREAIPILDRAIERFGETGFGLRLAALRLSRGRLYERAGDRAAAERDWSAGIARLETERRSLTEEDLRMSQAGSLRDIWSAVALSRLQAGTAAAESLDAVERSHARTLVEHALANRSELPSVAEIAKRLRRGEGVLYFLIRDQTAVGWLVTTDAVVWHPLGASPAAITALAHRYRRVVESRGSEDAFRRVSTVMHETLLTAFAAELREIVSLVIVPDSLLAGVSFASLIDPRSGHFLITDRSVAMAPSGGLLVEAGPPRATATSRALIVGVGAGTEFDALPWVDEEVRQVAAHHPGSVVLQHGAATKARFLEALSQADVLHFSGHAMGNPISPLLSRFVLDSDAANGSDLYAYELLQAHALPGSLVVLAACRSGFLPQTATEDDGVLSLARPFLARGTQAVLASLWDVSDRHSVSVMARLHERLASQPPSTAWRATILDAIANGAPVLEGWAAYALFLGRDGLSARPLAAERSATGVTR